MSYLVFYITHPDEDTARKISNALIDHRYIACANVYPVSSEYRWKDNVEQASEWVSLCKTSYDNIDRVERLVAQMHPYEVPCISRWDASANAEYEKWIFKNVLR